MFSLSKQNSPLTSSFDEPVFQNQQYLKSLQKGYLNNGYQSSINNKQSKTQIQRQRRLQEMEEYKKKNQIYLNEMAQSRIHKAQQKMYLANNYDEMINNKKMKEQEQRRYDVNLERQMLRKNTWVRDSNSEREINKKKINFYSQELGKHVKDQQMRKSYQEEQQKRMKQKINAEAEQILKKEYEQMQKRYYRKSKFEERQNNILGINNIVSSRNLQSRELSPSYEQQMALRRQEQQVYEKGLKSQLNVEEQRKKKEINNHFNPGQSYNPITNPIPMAFKNPNVLRMLSQR